MKVEIWSDVVCPWCYIGKRRFERAVEAFRVSHPEVEIDISYRAFQLDPTAPPGVSEPVRQAYEKKFGGPEQAQALIDRVTSEAAAEGLDFDLDIAQRSNTLLAHRLLALAEQEGVQAELKERLMLAYFAEGASVGDPDTLVDLAADVGIDRARSRAWLDGDGGLTEVHEQLQFAAQAQIHAVPTYVFDRRAGVPGAQPTEVFVEVLETISNAD